MAAFALETFFLIFFVTAIALTIVAVLFVFKTTKLRSKKELQEKRMGIIDKHNACMHDQNRMSIL